MNIAKPKLDQGLIKFSLGDGESLDLTPQQCWEWIEEARSLIIDHNTELNPPVVQKVERNGKTFQVAITKNSDYWKLVSDGQWEPDTFRVFDYFVSKDSCYLDIGAWIGSTAFYAAQLAKRAYAFEPDPVAYAELSANLRVNQDAAWASKLTIHQKAVATQEGVLKLGSRRSGGDSKSSFLFSHHETSWDVQAITLERFLETEKLENEKLFIKMDIEGAEYDLVPTLGPILSRPHTELFLSIHPRYIAAHLTRGRQNNFGTKLTQRVLAAWNQYKLLKALPFHYLYRVNGTRVNNFTDFLQALVFGTCLTEVVGTNREWTQGA